MNYREATPQELLNNLRVRNTELTELNLELDKIAKEKDLLEREYKRNLAIKLLELRADKIPLAIIQDIAKGDELIGELRYLRDNAKSKYSICLSAISNKKVQIDSIRSNLTWLRTELGNKD